MRKPMSPCYKCEFHSSTCHANCGFYQKFHDDLEEWNAIIRNGKKQLYSTCLLYTSIIKFTLMLGKQKILMRKDL